MEAKVISGRNEVEGRMQELGVPEKLLREAIEAAERFRRGMNPNHPPLAIGFMPWSELVCALRDLLMPVGWLKSDEGGLPLVIHPSGTLAIAVLTGNEGTGIDDSDLRSKYPRGPRTKTLVANNANQLEFRKLPFQAKPSADACQRILTWYLMLCRTPDEVRFELALPYLVGDGQRVVG